MVSKVKKSVKKVFKHKVSRKVVSKKKVKIIRPKKKMSRGASGKSKSSKVQKLMMLARTKPKNKK